MYMRPSRPSPRPARCRLLKTIALSVSALGLVGTGPTDPGSGRGISPSKDRVATPIFVPAFMTGYEINESSATPANEIAWMVFENTSPQQDAPPWAMSVFYENAGDVGDRYARVIDDPTTNEANRVLHYWLKNAVIDSGFQEHTKGRIQTGFPGQLVDAYKIYSRQRIFFHEDMNLILTYPADGDSWWHGVIFHDFWMGAAWLDHPNPSLISLTLFRYDGALRISMLHKTMPDQRTIWSRQNLAYEMPIGEWFTIELGIKTGDAQTGRAVVVITPESTGISTIVFNVTNWTYDPEADQPGGTGPVPVTHWNAQKLYASDNMIHHIRDAGGVMQAYFDDFTFSDEWPIGWPD
jgi:hypothetical protein